MKESFLFLWIVKGQWICFMFFRNSGHYFVFENRVWFSQQAGVVIAAMLAGVPFSNPSL